MSMQLKGTVLFNHASMLPPTDVNRGSISSAVVISFSSILILSCDIFLLLQILMLIQAGPLLYLLSPSHEEGGQEEICMMS